MPQVTRGTRDDAVTVQRLLGPAGNAFDLDRELSRSHTLFWVVRGDESELEASGFLLAWDVADEVHVIDLVVAASERRRGLGRALLLALLAHATERRARLILLEVRRTNDPAIALYRALGFEQIGERQRYYVDGEDALLMQIELRGP